MNKRIVTIGIVIALAMIVVFPRVLDLDAVRSPDEKRWLANTNGFVTKLSQGRVSELVQQPHPGITTQWLGSLSIRAQSWEVKKLPLVIGQSLLILLIGYIFRRRWGSTAGIIVVMLLATNPFLFAHTRVYAMDSLLSLFLLLSIASLLLWSKESSARYFVLAAFAGAAATLSKLPGILVAPLSILLLTYWAWRHGWGIHRWFKTCVAWVLAFGLSLAVILPSIFVAPLGVYGSFAELFRSDEYLAAHAAPASYYLESLIFFSTPLHLVVLLILAVIGYRELKKKGSSLEYETIVVFLAVAALFIVQMMLGLKKGDRYVLPSFLFFDGIAALVLAWIVVHRHQLWQRIAIAVAVLAVCWQALIIVSDYQHQLAYVNPLTQQWYDDRRHGWGEGLDLAAQYLNSKHNSESLTAASVFPNEFGHYFEGHTVNAHQHDSGSVDYVIVYRSMLQRGKDAWETDVVNHYQSQEPEHIVRLSGIDMAWIYPIED